MYHNCINIVRLFWKAIRNNLGQNKIMAKWTLDTRCTLWFKLKTAKLQHVQLATSALYLEVVIYSETTCLPHRWSKLARLVSHTYVHHPCPVICLWSKLKGQVRSGQTGDIDPMWVYVCSSVTDSGPKLKQYWVNFSRLLRMSTLSITRNRGRLSV